MDRSSRGFSARGRGHGRGVYFRGNFHQTSRTQVLSSPAPPLGELLERITDTSQLSNNTARDVDAKITECQYVASFNWLKAEKPSIVIPGLPPKWKPLIKRGKLDEDASEYFRDVNAAHYPSHPVEPAVRAFLAQAPEIPGDDVDIVACGSTIGNLLRFVRKKDRPFRFVVENVGETVFFVRRENSPTEKITDVKGYGHTFPEANTDLDTCVKGSDSHQRLIKYDFAGFQCIVRYEVDGYLPEKAGELGDGARVSGLSHLEHLKFIAGGNIVPQEAIFDLKTRSIWKQLSLDDVLDGEIDRLWARQIPNFILAYHQKGIFNDVGVHDVRERIKLWEQEHQDELRLLSTVIAKIVSRARSQPGERFEVHYGHPSQGVLEIRQVGGDFPRTLPDDLVRLWTQRGDEVESDRETDVEAGSSDGGNGVAVDSDDEEEGPDYTACSEDCEYCGRCGSKYV